MLVSVNAANTGLSPLARGTHILQNTRLISTRFIPAGAGNTRRLISAARDSPVYPRWRGEHAVQNFLKRFNCGLSPLARGTHRPGTTIRANRRFIPAGAGNTTVQTAGYYFFAVYPRWRGEHLLLELVECCYSGLSPLARGTHACSIGSEKGARFIPAGAGNTFKYVYLLIAISGLSPLARGTPALFAALSLVARFIPAGAGNTRTRRSSSRKNAVYPRWRGEHC